jgi:N-acetylglucosaminyldiphosphoundecaprenol N-acetyl-beta-D-mannosaminyltransferase
VEDIKILGVKITSAKPEEIHQEISRLIHTGGPGFVLSGNIHSLNLARKNPWLADFFNQADLVRVDGSGIVLGGRLLGHSVNQRLTWADWGWMLGAYAASQGHTLFLLGGPQGAASEAALKLAEHSPGLEVVGTHHGFFSKKGPENDAIIAQINRAKPDILVVGLGMPLQERWLLDNYSSIKAKVFITSGAAFQYLAGWTKRCPQWMASNGLEWLYRLLQEPAAKAKRYLWGNPVFIFHVLKEKYGRGRKRAS